MTTPELKVNTQELRALMGRAHLSQQRLGKASGLHRNSIANILTHEIADLTSLAAITVALNEELARYGEPLISPLDLLLPVGFPPPQQAAALAMRAPMASPTPQGVFAFA